MCRGVPHIIEIQVEHRARGRMQMKRRGLDWRITPAMAIDPAACIHSGEKLPDRGPTPPADASDEEVGKIDAVCRERRMRWLQQGGCHEVAHPRVECLHSLGV
eukprot:2258270-Prymnesium_polylepis.3